MAKGGATAGAREEVLARLVALRLHQRDGRRSPHKPLLVLLALGRLAATGSSALPWSQAQDQLGNLIAEFGPASRTGRVQSAAYPFTRLRSDGIWVLDRDVPMDTIGPLAAQPVTGRFAPAVEKVLADDPGLLVSAARALVESHFPDTISADVLSAVGLNPDTVLHAVDTVPDPSGKATRRRDPNWREAIIQAWDRQCAFCGFDGAALRRHRRDRRRPRALVRPGWPGRPGQRAGPVRAAPQAVRPGRAGRGPRPAHPRVDHLHRPDQRRPCPLQPARGRARGPAAEHLRWHRRWVFKGRPLAA